MPLPRHLRIVIAAPVLSFALIAVPALAQDDLRPSLPVHTQQSASGLQPAPAGITMSQEARASWVGECASRMGKRRKRTAANICESYLDDYYAYYSAAQSHYYQNTTYRYQPVMMVPAARATNTISACREIDEYE